MKIGSRVLGSLIITVATTSHADTASDRKNASAHVVAGDQKKVQAELASEEGDREQANSLFREAAAEYRQAYDLVPHPPMLYNQAQAYRLGGKPARSLKRRQRKEDAKDRRRQDTKTPAQVIAAPKRTELSDGLTNREIAGFSLAGVGVISLIVATKFGLDAKSASDCLSSYPNNCTQPFPEGRWTEASLLLEEEGENAETRMYVFSALGAVAILGGGLLYFLADKQASTTSLSLVPVDGAPRLVLQGSF